MTTEEDKIWRSIQEKDRRAFEQYYKDHYKLFFVAAFKYLEDAGQAQEVVNDVFVTLWQNAEKVIIQSSLKAYLHRSVINRSLNLLDKKKRDRQQLQNSLQAEEVSESKELETNELKIQLYRAIDQLPDQCRKVFRLSRFEQLKQQEIADRLGISIKTVKNHITNALQQLKQVLDDWHNLPLWIILFESFLMTALGPSSPFFVLYK
jgi:RNA polymerase sigma-70 factor (ECF subfamily)